LPDSAFISSNQPVARPAPLTTCTKTGKEVASRKRKAAETTSSRTWKELQAKKASNIKEE